VTDLRCSEGDSEAAKKILTLAVLLVMTVFVGLMVFFFVWIRGWMVKEGWCHVGVDG
jgi:hypothetical protein